MDKYTLMASKLKPLQDEWEPRIGDRVSFRNSLRFKYGYSYKIIVSNITFSPTNTKIVLKNINSCGNDSIDISLPKERFRLTWLPSLEDLIEIWKYNGDWIFMVSGKGVHGKSNYYQVKQLANKPYKVFGDKTLQEALLKLVDYERWSLVWSGEKEEWVNG